MGTQRYRIDELLVLKGLFPDTASAMRAVLAGDVSLDGQTVTQAGRRIADNASLSVVSHPRFVSRGGEKLAGALEAFGFSAKGLSCLDCGASTGGFTDCLLQNGAARIVAVDVGYGQFAWSLRQDKRVVLFERTNIRELDREAAGSPFDLAVADVSFAPLHSYVDAVRELLREDGTLITLVKPQFEAPRTLVDAGGVVSQASTHAAVLERAMSLLCEKGFLVRGLCVSPIKGPAGNIEFFIQADVRGEVPLPEGDARIGRADIERVVVWAHETMNGDCPSLEEQQSHEEDDRQHEGCSRS